MDISIIISTVLFGLVFGSFLNVLIYRVPRGESAAMPASHCPACEHPLAVKDNIPVFSYVLLRGKCRYCAAPISIQYPLVELATAVCAVSALLLYGLTVNFFLAVFFLLILLTVSVIDIHHKIIPNAIILPAMATSAAAVVALNVFAGGSGLRLVDTLTIINAAAGFLIGGGLLFLLALIWPSGMGGGDIKLAAFMGLFLGRYVVVALFIGFFLGSVGGVAAMALLGKGRKDQIPFGPYLAAGSVVTLFFGEALVKWYLGLSGLA